VTNLLFNYANSTVGIFKTLVMVPLYLHYVSLGTYGAWLASGNIVALLGFVDLGLNVVLTQRLADASGTGNGKAFVSVSGAGLCLTMFSVLSLASAVVLLSPFIPTWVHAPVEGRANLSRAILYEGLGSAAMLLTFGFWSVVQAWQWTLPSGIAAVVGSVIGASATVWGLWSGMGISAIGLGGLLRGTCSASFLAVCVTWEWRRRGFARPRFLLVENLSLLRATALPFLGRTASVAMTNCESAFISIYINPESAAILSLTGRAFQGCLMILSPISTSVFAGIAHLSACEPLARVRRVLGELFSTVALVSALLFGVAVALNPGFMQLWVGPGRFGGVGLSVLICAAAAVTSLYNFVGVVLPALGEINRSAGCALSEAVVRLGFIFVLIRHLGIASMPTAALSSAAAVSLWYMFRVLRLRLGLNTVEALRLLATDLPVLVVSIGGGAVLGAVLPIWRSWPLFILQAIAVGLVIGSGVLLTSSFARQRAAAFAAGATARLRLAL